MSEIALKAISITVGLFFIFFGVLKIGPLFSEELYRDIRKLFVRYASAFPFHERLGWTPNPHTIRRVYGGIEIVSGVVMACGRGILGDISNCSLLCLIFYSLYSTWALDDGMKEASHSIVLGLVLTCRFVIRLQTFQKPKEETANFEDDDDDMQNVFRSELKRRLMELHQSIEDARILVEKEHQAENASSKIVDATIKTADKKND